jgi:hypothetical protein
MPKMPEMMEVTTTAAEMVKLRGRARSMRFLTESGVRITLILRPRAQGFGKLSI